MIVFRDKSASLVEHLFLTNEQSPLCDCEPNLVTARDGSAHEPRSLKCRHAGIPGQYIDVMQNRQE